MQGGAGRSKRTDGAASARKHTVVPKHGTQRIADSLSVLDDKKSHGIDHTTSVRVEADERENKRRIEEEERRQDRLWRLQEEAVASGKANAAVEMRWTDLEQYNMPQDLHNELEAQKAACARIIGSKDQLIREFKAELKAKDEEYVKATTRHAQEIDTLIERMRAQYKELRQAYDTEQDQVEDAFKREHAELLEAHRNEIDALLEERRQTENKLVEDRMERERKYQSELDEMQSRDAEDYNKLKIKLETDVQVLEQQLELMRSTYLLNTEKLEYNYRVLTEKDNENEIAENQQKAKLKRLDAALSKIMSEYRTADKKYKQRNAQLTRDYARITAQYRDLQYKFSHFDATDTAKFREVWSMHEADTSALIDRLLAADRVITEQIMGWEWQAPKLPEKPGTTPQATPSHSEGEVGGPSSAGATADSRNNNFSKEGQTTLYGCEPSLQEYAHEVDITTPAIALLIPLLSNDHNETPANSRKVHEAKIKARAKRLARIRVVIYRLLGDCTFLLEPKILLAAQQQQDEDVGDAIKANSLLKTIGITNEAEMDKLVESFFSIDESAEESADDALESGLELSSGMHKEDPARAIEQKIASECEVPPGRVVEALTSFVQQREAARHEAAAAQDPYGFGSRSNARTSSADSGINSQALLQKLRTGNTAGSASGTLDGSTSQQAGAHVRARRDEADYWARLAEVIPSQKIRVWKALEKSLTNYNELLRKRSQTMDEVDSLRSQNAELRQLLEQYLNAKINDELQVPPTQTMRLAKK